MPGQEWGALGALMMKEADSLAELSLEGFGQRLQATTQAATWGIEDINELGNRLFGAGAYGHAAICYERVAWDPRAYGALANLGRCQIRLGQLDDAEARAHALVEEQPLRPMGWQLLSEVMVARRRMPEALEAAQRAAELSTDHGMLARQWAALAVEARDIETAVKAFRLAWEREPKDFRSLGLLVFYMRCLCIWENLDELSARLLRAVIEDNAELPPFDFLAEPATAAQQAVCARRQAASMTGTAVSHPLERLTSPAPTASNRLRVGFVSHGIGRHPTAILTVGLFEALCHSSIEVQIFSTRGERDSALRQRIAAATHAFHDLAGMPQREVAAFIQAQHLDVLVDMDGYSRVRLPEVCAYRPAPLQVSWLAYPGTTGADYMDYVIADRYVLPASMQTHFSEKAAYLPRCYQCSDPSRVIGQPPSREACGLPEDGVVYACFNTSFKLNPRSVRRMLQVLVAVPGSVLWLLQGEGDMERRLREEAERAGVVPSRLVFMQKLAHRAYLARYRHVDLFLDTEDYNAHTVASDALWSGCPVLTRPGETFASRVAGSLNHHLGMPEMNAADDAAFVMKAVRFGRDGAYRAAIKAKLLKQRAESGLFDIEGFARDFEGLLWRMAEHRRAGKLPETFES
jgi:predicted O-linked N-acetylglucosamine transferase (SPINDLY family)